MIRRILALALLCAAAAAQAEEQAPRQVLLRHTLAPGDVLKYRGRIQGTGTISFMGERQPVKIQGEFSLLQKVLAVGEDGRIRITTTLEGGSLVFQTPSVSQRLPVSLPALTQTISPDGRLLASEGWKREDGHASRAHINLRRVIERIHLLHFPGAPVGVGDSWVRAPQPPPEPPKTGSGQPDEAPSAPDPPPSPEPSWKLTLLGFERLGKQECARIRAAADAPIKDVLPPDPMGDIVEVEGKERLQTVTFFSLIAGRVARQVASAHTTLRTQTYPAAGGQVVTGETDINATVTLELR